MTLCACGGVIIQLQVLRVGQINIAIATYLPCCGFSYWVIISRGNDLLQLVDVGASCLVVLLYHKFNVVYRPHSFFIAT